MSKTTQHINELWDKYLDGSCNKNELEELFQLIQADEQHLDQLNFNNYAEKTLIQHWQNEPLINKSLIPLRKESNKSFQPLFYFIAAASLIIITVSIFWLSDTNKTTPFFSVRKKIPSINYVKANSNSIILPDGSLIILKSNASIEKQIFNDEQRVIYLKGDAFFDVKHDNDRPFVVYSKGIKVRVLGTAFYIKNMPNNTVKVDVTRGRVEVSYQAKALKVVLPEQSISYNIEHQKIQFFSKIDTIDISKQFTTDKEWRWNDVKLSEVIQWLNDYYDVTIVMDDNRFKNVSFSGGFILPVQLEDILSVIEKLYNINIQKMDAKHYTFIDK